MRGIRGNFRALYDSLAGDVFKVTRQRVYTDRIKQVIGPFLRAANEHFTDGCIKLVRNGAVCMGENGDAALHFRGAVILRATQPPTSPFDALFQYIL